MIPGAIETNLTVTVRDGTTVTGDGTAHTKGAWAEVIASTGAAANGIWVCVRNVGVSATDTETLLDIGTGPAASEAVLIPDINAGAAAVATSSAITGQIRFFPVAISAGTRISARLQGTQTSETAIVAIWLAQSIQHVTGASAVEAVGEVTASSRGTLVSSGNGAWGAWTSIGTITADRNVFMVGLDGGGDTTFAADGAGAQLVQIGYGTSAPGSGGTAIEAIFRSSYDSGEEIGGPFPTIPVYADLASGETLWARLAGNHTEARGVLIQAMECPLAGGGSGAGHAILGGPIR